MKEIKEDFAKLIREWRLERNLGLRDFSKLIDISPTLLSSIENPKHEEDYKKLIKKIKGGEVRQIVCGKDNCKIIEINT